MRQGYRDQRVVIQATAKSITNFEGPSERWETMKFAKVVLVLLGIGLSVNRRHRQDKKLTICGVVKKRS